MSIYSKTGERIIDIKVGADCYFQGKLLQVWATLEGELSKRRLYISDLKQDHKNEIKQAVSTALGGGKAQ